MRTFSVVFVASALTLAAWPAQAQEASLRARTAARRDLERAKNDLRCYWQVEYPRQCRELDATIEITRTEIADNYSLLRQYRPITRFSLDEPYPVTVRNIKLCIKMGELQLTNLLDERNALARCHLYHYHDLAEQVHEARLRVLELESSDTASAQPVEELPAQ